MTRSELMSRIRSVSALELRVRAALPPGFVTNPPNLPGKPDVAWIRKRVALFVHGCFWHWHGCSRSRMPKRNRGFWAAKLERNRERDREVYAALIALGWRVFTVWECEVSDLAAVVAEIREVLNAD